MSIKRLNMLRRVISDSGLTLVDSGADGVRWYAIAQAPNGETQRFSFSKKEGDLRGDLNESSKIKRFANGNNVITADLSMPNNTNPDVSVTVKKKMHLVPQNEAVETPPTTSAPTAPPEPEKPASAPPAAPAKAAQNRLHRAEFYKLTKLIEPLDTLTFATLDALAQHATAQLGFPVNKSSVADALDAMGKMTQAQNNLHNPKQKVSGGAIAVLARSLCALYEHLGETAPDDLKRLVK